MTPNSVSPVLKQTLTFVIEDIFSYPMNKEDFEVTVYSATNGAYRKPLRPVSASESPKNLTVMFGGAYSGDYRFIISHKTEGYLKTLNPDIALTVGSNVTSVTPMQASTCGGTVLTITGTNFGTQVTDNPVSVVFNGGIGAIPCIVNATTLTTTSI